MRKNKSKLFVFHADNLALIELNKSNLRKNHYKEKNKTVPSNSVGITCF